MVVIIIMMIIIITIIIIKTKGKSGSMSTDNLLPHTRFTIRVGVSEIGLI